jgi:hypothetical protein
MAAKKAAVDPEVLGRPLGEISAAEFVGALSESRLAAHELTVLADKKKYELWVDETPIDKISVIDLLDAVRAEKKKLELEKRPWEYFKRAVEFDFDPTRLRDPVIREELVSEIADEVVKRLGR